MESKVWKRTKKTKKKEKKNQIEIKIKIKPIFSLKLIIPNNIKLKAKYQVVSWMTPMEKLEWHSSKDQVVPYVIPISMLTKKGIIWTKIILKWLLHHVNIEGIYVNIPK